jgi:hypothetical protein
MGLAELPPDIRLQLMALPRQEAYQKIAEFIEQQRAAVQDMMIQRRQQDYDLMKTLIENGTLEEMDLVDFGTSLVKRYQHAYASEELLGMSPSILFGSSSKRQIGEGESSDKPQLPETQSEQKSSPETDKDPSDVVDETEGDQSSKVDSEEV